jgi:hypothetical protein
MRYPNWFMPTITGKFMSLKNDVPSLIKPGDIIKVEDLEKAYYKIPVSKAAQVYQCFRGPDNRLYAITCLPFGHRLATWIFTKICQPLKAFFGVLKMPSFNYIDDRFWSILKALMPRLAPIIDRVFVILGWTFAARKAQLGTCVKVLGFNLDVDKRMFTVPDSKVRRALTQGDVHTALSLSLQILQLLAQQYALTLHVTCTLSLLCPNGQVHLGGRL